MWMRHVPGNESAHVIATVIVTAIRLATRREGVVADDVDDPPKTQRTHVSAIATLGVREATIESGTSGTTGLQVENDTTEQGGRAGEERASGREMSVGRESGIESVGRIGMCRACKTAFLAGDTQRVALTKRVCSLGGQIVRFLKEL